ncbi:MAG: MraY family glycosyltransferase [Thermodesulfovibrionales bacterium]|nr:MraY family glycosyltransferase [Thermodesulfovibrionales bacterium]
MSEDTTNLLQISLTFLSSLFLVLLVLPQLAHIASRIGLLDHPNGRKVHRTPKPLVGGIGMVMAMSVSCLLFIPLSNLRGFFSGLILLVVTGFLDDFREISHRWRFVAQMAAAIFIMYFSETILLSFGNFLAFGPLNLGVFAVPLTIFCTVGVINAINMIDGIDGLAGGISLIALVSFSVLSYANQQKELFLLSIAMAGAVAGFLKYNWHPAKLFMGDAGSLVLGFSLTFFSIAVTQKEDSIVPPVVPLLILAVPIVDTVTVMIKRVIKGKSPFSADRNHLHHILLMMGFTKTTVVRIMLTASAIFSFVGIIGVFMGMPEYYMFMFFAIYFLLYFGGSFYIREIYRLKVKVWRKICGQY